MANFFHVAISLQDARFRNDYVTAFFPFHYKNALVILKQ